MKNYYLIVDGMLSGTGIRDAIEGGYINPRDLGITTDLMTDISTWLHRYEYAHYGHFENAQEIANLDALGMALCKRLIEELPHSKIEYFSSAKMQKIRFEES